MEVIVIVLLILIIAIMIITLRRINSNYWDIKGEFKHIEQELSWNPIKSLIKKEKFNKELVIKNNDFKLKEVFGNYLQDIECVIQFNEARFLGKFLSYTPYLKEICFQGFISSFLHCEEEYTDKRIKNSFLRVKHDKFTISLNKAILKQYHHLPEQGRQRVTFFLHKDFDCDKDLQVEYRLNKTED